MLRTRRLLVDLDDLRPNERQPRMGDKVDEELQRQIEANEGLFEPLLVEPDPESPARFRIIDGERRWTNLRVLADAGKQEYRRVPVEATDRVLSDEERLRAWIYIHRQRKEWDAKEKEMVAYRLVELVGRASAANILGVTVRELDRLVQIFELSEQFRDLPESAAAITWARELNGIAKTLVTPTVVEAVTTKVSKRLITNSKDIRQLRTILRDPVARAHFLDDPNSTVQSAMMRIAGAAPAKASAKPLDDLQAAIGALRSLSWTEVGALKGDPDAVARLDDAVSLLQALRGSIADT
ncbi:chromosome partitioning protein, ParB family [Jatrophihabitans endophyticus]|uniref:Chromosome partitioning protein, ParB family n=1 Tax=Jatrophihabitans endophyticus TaxID=1206085 RepID=A0A1M5CVP5_9ACTN|nr:chromosome partitioning protein, ParB family [Jatrophihabitans endophyticus]